MLRKGHDLGSRRPGWPYPSAAWAAGAERDHVLSGRFPAIVRGEEEPRDTGETVAFARMAYGQKYFATATRLWTESMKRSPKLIDDRRVQPRYNAACAAALAAAGQGKGEPPFDEAAKSRWHKQAIEWLNADLAVWSKQAETGPPEARQNVSRILQHWKTVPDLAGLREL